MASDLSIELVRFCYNLPSKPVAYASAVPVHACDFCPVEFLSQPALTRGCGSYYYLTVTYRNNT